MKTGQAVIDAAEIEFPEQRGDLGAAAIAIQFVARERRYTGSAKWIGKELHSLIQLAYPTGETTNTREAAAAYAFILGYFWAHAVIERERVTRN